MNEMNASLLKKAFPTVFSENFYFEHRDGWFELVAKVAAFISTKTPHCYIVQCKEKFGKIRIYVESETGDSGISFVHEKDLNEIYSFINGIENESANICELCGTTLTAANRQEQKQYWISNVCAPCGKKSNERMF